MDHISEATTMSKGIDEYDGAQLALCEGHAKRVASGQETASDRGAHAQCGVVWCGLGNFSSRIILFRLKVLPYIAQGAAGLMVPLSCIAVSWCAEEKHGPRLS